MLWEHIFYYFPTFSLLPNRYNIINLFQPHTPKKKIQNTNSCKKESEELVAWVLTGTFIIAGTIKMIKWRGNLAANYAFYAIKKSAFRIHFRLRCALAPSWWSEREGWLPRNQTKGKSFLGSVKPLFFSLYWILGRMAQLNKPSLSPQVDV